MGLARLTQMTIRFITTISMITGFQQPFIHLITIIHGMMDTHQEVITGVNSME